MVEHIRFEDGAVTLLDQRFLPHEIRWVRCADAESTAAAIKAMVVRGAPAIGITAAYGYVAEAIRGGDLAKARETLLSSRPTAVNLRWALELLAQANTVEALHEIAKQIHQEDIGINKAIGDCGAAILPNPTTIYTHCNTGTLATGGWGTALGVARSANQRGQLTMVYAGETRPYLQGARLTAWECAEENIPCTLVTDSTAATLMAANKIDAVIVGCDRVANNGDAANKIGTLGLAVLAKHYDIPFYIAMPTSTLDRKCPSANDIPIEQRPAAEVRGFQDMIWAADVNVFNPAFDVTPADLIAGWISEFGVWHPPFPHP
ncbi:MAG: S-methyl-5-thioribose-1-phosphate isomerase [Proteobacteria bacterium]|nr:S-methyl-5-thioribose-1-phosphate isomerase [Pseudomonadota bacterium]